MGLARLADDELLRVLAGLDARSLARAARGCRRLYDLSRADALWAALLVRRLWPQYLSAPAATGSTSDDPTASSPTAALAEGGRPMRDLFMQHARIPRPVFGFLFDDRPHDDAYGGAWRCTTALQPPGAGPGPRRAALQGMLSVSPWSWAEGDEMGSDATLQFWLWGCHSGRRLLFVDCEADFFALQVERDGQLMIEGVGGDSLDGDMTRVGPLLDTEHWHHLCLVFATKQPSFKVFLDGCEALSIEGPPPPFGCLHFTACGGAIAEVAAWDQVLEPAQVEILTRFGVPLPSSIADPLPARVQSFPVRDEQRPRKKRRKKVSKSPL
eukprot:EG_transcript_16707